MQTASNPKHIRFMEPTIEKFGSEFVTANVYSKKVVEVLFLALGDPGSPVLPRHCSPRWGRQTLKVRGAHWFSFASNSLSEGGASVQFRVKLSKWEGSHRFSFASNSQSEGGASVQFRVKLSKWRGCIGSVSPQTLKVRGVHRFSFASNSQSEGAHRLIFASNSQCEEGASVQFRGKIFFSIRQNVFMRKAHHFFTWF